MFEGLKKCEEDLLDVPSYGELFGEVILERNRKLESKRRHFFSLKKRTPGHCILGLSLFPRHGTTWIIHTVEPLYKGHRWGQKFCPL